MPSIDGVALVNDVKSLGFILQQGLSFDLHVTKLLKQYSQRIYLLRLLRRQGLSIDQLNMVLLAWLYLVCCMLYPLGEC